ncbi:MAG TPA: hypothetical protein VGM99_01270 [Candidatus Cybelea sp.]
MTALPAMICARCNQLRSESDMCSTCGARLQSLDSAKRRGWVALSAGAFMVVFVGAAWLWVDRTMAAQGVSTPDVATAKFLGRIHISFALVVVAGLLGIANGWLMVQSGRRNRVLIFTLVAVFVAAVFFAASAST